CLQEDDRVGSRFARTARVDCPPTVSSLRRLRGPAVALGRPESRHRGQQDSWPFEPRRNDEPQGPFANRGVQQPALCVLRALSLEQKELDAHLTVTTLLLAPSRLLELIDFFQNREVFLDLVMLSGLVFGLFNLIDGRLKRRADVGVRIVQTLLRGWHGGLGF